MQQWFRNWYRPIYGVTYELTYVITLEPCICHLIILLIIISLLDVIYAFLHHLLFLLFFSTSFCCGSLLMLSQFYQSMSNFLIKYMLPLLLFNFLMSFCVSICIFCIFESHKCFSWVPFRWLWEFLQSATLSLVIFKVLSSISLSFLFSLSLSLGILSKIHFINFYCEFHELHPFCAFQLSQSCGQDARFTQSPSLSLLLYILNKSYHLLLYINNFFKSHKKDGRGCLVVQFENCYL